MAPGQLALELAAPLPVTSAEGLRDALDDLVEVAVAKVVLTDNRSRILSVRQTPAGLVVRAHRCFVASPPSLLPCLAALLSPAPRGGRGAGRRRALAEVRAFFDAQAVAAPVMRLLRPVGETLDLVALRDEINHDYFAGRLEVGITWGRWGRRRKRGRGGSIRLGSFDQRLALVRVHPALDAAFVPRYVVLSIVHHEMLHAALPPAVRGGRRILHGAEFRRREREFRDHERAERWIAANLERLLRS